MGRQPDDHGEDAAAIWRHILHHGGHRDLRFAHRVFPYLPRPPRCKFCRSPFAGLGGRVCRVFGLSPSRKNPQLCDLCCEKLPPGGAEVEVAVLFADVRGSTALAEELGATAYAATLNRFYATATEVLIRHEATVDKLIGDEVMAFFVPGFAGPAFRRSAVEAGRALLRALRHGGREPPWLPVGIGIESGIAFVGNVGANSQIDFTALGDPVNTAARIRSAAGPGELLVGEGAFAAVSDTWPGLEPRDLEVKGKTQPIRVRSVPP
jgi:adenylate cyclase